MKTLIIQFKVATIFCASFLIFQLLSSSFVKAQHTFSIVAIDTITGEVGGAGATCYAVVNDIADVHPGVGFIHTQSYVDYTNQAYGKDLMDRGFLPQEIMDSLVAYDATGQPGLRQYTAVSLLGTQKSAAFTGANCFNYKGQRLGANYAIAGNILLGPEILDSMESRFNNTVGTLADKLMAAMQGAKVEGADIRCAGDGVSSLSAYMIVAKPNDTSPNYYLNLNVENVYPVEPIDVLQDQYNLFLQSVGIKKLEIEKDIKVIPNPASTGYVKVSSPTEIMFIDLININGNIVQHKYVEEKHTEICIESLPSGFYLCKITDNLKNTYFKKIVIQ